MILKEAERIDGHLPKPQANMMKCRISVATSVFLQRNLSAMLRINYANVRRNSWAEIDTVSMKFPHKNKSYQAGREREIAGSTRFRKLVHVSTVNGGGSSRK